MFMVLHILNIILNKRMRLMKRENMMVLPIFLFCLVNCCDEEFVESLL